MKTSKFFAAALLSLGFGISAHAQTPVTGAPGTLTTPGSVATPAMGTGTVAPGTVGAGTGTGVISPSAVTPTGTSGTLYPANGVPARNIDGGTLRADQPVGNSPTSGSQPTRRLNRGRTTTSGSTTTTRP